jgi:bifunctional DNase/RNase
MTAMTTVLILLVGLVNLLPMAGVLSGARLEALYGVALQDPNIVILMRHRAVLFGIVGGLLVSAAFHAPLRAAAYGAGFVSMLSFVLIAWLVGGLNAELRRVVIVDLIASAALFVATLLDHVAARSPGAA